MTDPYDAHVDTLIDDAARNGWGGEPQQTDDDAPWLPDSEDIDSRACALRERLMPFGHPVWRWDDLSDNLKERWRECVREMEAASGVDVGEEGRGME